MATQDKKNQFVFPIAPFFVLALVGWLLYKMK
jgi:predicted permease